MDKINLTLEEHITLINEELDELKNSVTEIDKILNIIADRLNEVDPLSSDEESVPCVHNECGTDNEKYYSGDNDSVETLCEVYFAQHITPDGLENRKINVNSTKKNEDLKTIGLITYEQEDGKTPRAEMDDKFVVVPKELWEVVKSIATYEEQQNCFEIHILSNYR